MFENIKSDYNSHNREILNWGFVSMIVYRFGKWRYTVKNGILRKPFSIIYKLMFFYIKGKGIEIPCEVGIGKNFRIDHQGGIVVSRVS